MFLSQPTGFTSFSILLPIPQGGGRSEQAVGVKPPHKWHICSSIPYCTGESQIKAQIQKSSPRARKSLSWNSVSCKQAGVLQKLIKDGNKGKVAKWHKIQQTRPVCPRPSSCHQKSKDLSYCLAMSVPSVFQHHQCLPLFSCRESWRCHHQKGESHTAKRTAALPCSKYPPEKQRWV